MSGQQPPPQSGLAEAEGALGPPPVDKVGEDVAMARIQSLLFGESQRPSLERYALLEKLGEGSYGAVYTAWDPRLDRKIAIKVLHGGANEALEREARALAKLSHPNVVAVHDVGESEGALFLAMEFVDGPPLSSLNVDALGWRRVVATYRQAAAGLAAAHDAGVIHRDFKPANALLGQDGRVRVLDFGLARAGSTDHGEAGPLVETRAGGTPLYMAPEQHRGDPVDARSDQFGFCAALWEALHSAPPFVGDTMAALAKAKCRPPVPPSSSRAPAALTRILQRGLAPEPADRYPSMRALDAALAATTRRRTRVLVATAIASAALGLGVAVGGAERPCVGSDAPPSRWTDASRDALTAAFAQTDLPHARTSANTTLRLLDDWSATWSTARKDACLAHDQGLQSDTGLDRRIACLDGQRQHFDALLDVFLEADAAAVDKAVDAVAALPTPAACSDVTRSHPVPAAERDAVERARPELARARAELDAGHYAQVAKRAADTLSACDSQALQHPPTCVEARLLQAESFAYLGQHDEAMTRLRDVVVEAQRADLRLPLARAAYQLTWELSQVDARFDEALMWAALGRASINADRTGVLAKLNNAEAVALSSAGRLDDAAAVHQRQLETLERGSALRMGPLVNLAGIHNRRGNADAAERAYAEALELGETTLGTTHPKVLMTRQNRAGMRVRLGRIDEGLADLRDVLDAQEAALGPHHPDLSATLVNLAIAYGSRRDAQAALDHAERATTIVDAAYGEESQLLIETLLAEADAHLALGHPSDAVSGAQRALRISTQHLGAEHAHTAFVLRTLGRARIADGDLRNGREDLSRALGLFRAAKMASEAAQTQTALDQSSAARSD